MAATSIEAAAAASGAAQGPRDRMKTLFAKAARAIRLVGARRPADPRVAALRAALGRPVGDSRSDGPRIAIQVVEDPLFFGLFGAIHAELERTCGARADLVLVRSVNGAIGTNWKSAIWRSVPVGRLISSQWARAFRPWSDRIGYRSLGIGGLLAELADTLRSRAVWRRVRHEDGDFAVTIDGIPVGDLIIDTYLRFRPSPQFRPADPFVRKLIRQAHRDVRNARRYFRRVRPELYLTSYSTYIQHGIAARVALQHGVRVMSFGSLARFGKALKTDDWFHTADTERYLRDFTQLDSPAERIEQAAAQLERRFSGRIDGAMSYMRASAYAKSGELPPADLKGAVVVFLHDFYDSPHIYHDIIFPDFWTWACFTIDALRESGVPFFLKPHPNQIALSGEALKALQAAYPDLRFLAPGITNTQLVEAGMAAGVTMYGSVSHELAYHGVPSICCARHPHNAFAFCRTARSRAEYRDLLRDPRVVPLPVAEMRRQALAFFYMQNLHGDADEIALRDLFVSFWKSFEAADLPLGDLVERFDALRLSAPFKRFVQQLLPSAARHADEPARAADEALATSSRN